MTIAALDGGFLVVLLLSALLGAWRGLVFEVLSLLAWVVAFLVAQTFAAQLAMVMPLSGLSDGVQYLVGFVLLFVLVLVACGLVVTLLKKVVAAVGLRPIDRALGALFGLVRGTLLLLAVVVVVGLTPLSRHAVWLASEGVPMLQGVYRSLLPLLPAELSGLLPA